MQLTMDSLFLKEKSLLQEREEEKGPGTWFKILFLFSLCLFFISCASKPEKTFVYEPSANAVDELRNLQVEMDRSELDQISVFSPNSYKQARKSLSKASDLHSRGESNQKVLKELGTARGFFEQAKTVAAQSERALPEVVDSRENALIAGAAVHEKADLQKADKKLIDKTEEFEKRSPPKISLDDRSELQKRYLDIELKAIKTNRLGNAQSTLNAAQRMGAEKYAPRSLSVALAKMRNADTVINTDRHNDALITPAANEAEIAANRLYKINEISRRTGRPGNEAMAIEIVNRDERMEAMNSKLSSQEAKSRSQAAQLQTQTQQLSQELTEAQKSATEARQALEARKKVDEAYAQAQSQFSAQEADVYRQGDNLIIRMKAVKFPSGRSDIPTNSFASLNKVRNIIQTLNAQKVVVEGHTDAVGDPHLNQQLSESRAQAVAQYLESQMDRRSGSSSSSAESTATPQVESHGYGYERPIASNKTKQGRTLNRRVDIIIVPQMNSSSTPASTD